MRVSGRNMPSHQNSVAINKFAAITFSTPLWSQKPADVFAKAFMINPPSAGFRRTPASLHNEPSIDSSRHLMILTSQDPMLLLMFGNTAVWAVLAGHCMSDLRGTHPSFTGTNAGQDRERDRCALERFFDDASMNPTTFADISFSS
jgi:hypothetical protein